MMGKSSRESAQLAVFWVGSNSLVIWGLGQKGGVRYVGAGCGSIVDGGLSGKEKILWYRGIGLGGGGGA